MNIDENNKSNKYSNYRTEDGSLNIKENIYCYTIEKSNCDNCPVCGKKINEGEIYCSNCGSILQKIKSKREKFISQEQEKNKLSNIIANFDFVNGFKVSLLAIGILITLSFIIKTFLIGNNNQISKIINPLHVMLFSNLSTMDIYMSLFMNSTQSSINLGLWVFLILPVISFILPYIIFMKPRNTSFVVHLKNSIAVGVIYGIILCIIAKISQVHVGISTGLSNGYTQMGYGIYIGFSAFSTLVKGFIIGFVSVFLMGIKKQYEDEEILVKIIKLTLKVVLIGYLLVLVTLIILYIANIDCTTSLGLSSYVNDKSIFIVFSQIAIYLWAFANLIPIYIGNQQISLSYLFNMNNSLDLNLVFVVFIAISALIFIIAGCKLENKFKNNGIKPVFMFSICYAVVMAVIAIFTNVYIGDNVSQIISSISSVQMGFNFLIGFVVSFIYSFIMTLIGFKLNIY